MQNYPWLIVKLVPFIFILMLFTSIADADFYLELGVGKNGLLQQEWVARDSTACMFGAGYIWQPAKRHIVDFSYRHNSQCTVGNGFDEREEDANDSVGIYYRYYIRN